MAKHLAKKHTVFYLGMQDVCHPPFKQDNIIRLPVRDKVPGCEDALPHYQRAFKIDLYLSAFDIWLPELAEWIRVVKSLPWAWLHHITINSDPPHPVLLERAKLADLVVAPSKYNLNSCLQFNLINTVYIPHFVNTEIFKPAKPKEKFEVRERLKIDSDEFVFISVMRNKKLNKDFENLFKGFRLFLEKNPNAKAKLVLLTCPTEFQGQNIYAMRQAWKLEKHVRFVWAKYDVENDVWTYTYEGDPDGFEHHPNIGFPPELVAEIYKCADVNLLISHGESFGLPAIEGYACKLPLIMAEHTTGPELVREPNGGLLVRAMPILYPQVMVSQYNTDPHDLAEKMTLLYKNENYRKELGENGYKFIKENYAKEKILPLWDKAVKLLLNPDVNFEVVEEMDGVVLKWQSAM